MQEGFFKGCIDRPIKGHLYCGRHARGDSHGGRAAACAEPRIDDHRKVVKDSTLLLEYQVDKKWLPAEGVTQSDVRAYEKPLLRKRTPLADHDCNEDTRKGVDETTVCGRKSAGILVAVTPCLQIAAMTPMFGSESIITLVLLFVLAMHSVFEDLVYIIYDNACAMIRHLNKRQRQCSGAMTTTSIWRWMMSLLWVIDRLHFGYHKACQDKNTPGLLYEKLL